MKRGEGMRQVVGVDGLARVAVVDTALASLGLGLALRLDPDTSPQAIHL
jgi:hypothetical protein